MNEWKYFDYKNLGLWCKQQMIAGNYQYLDLFKELLLLQLGKFRYKRLPENIHSRLIEYQLVFNTSLCMVRSDNLGGVILGNYKELKLNMNNEPETVSVTTLSGDYVGEYDYKDIVVLRDSPDGIPPFITMINTIEKLCNVQQTLDVNMNLYRLPILFTGSKNQLASLNTLAKKMLNCDPFAVVDKSLADTVQTADISPKISPLDLFKLYQNQRNLGLNRLGIYAGEVKRERIISGEVEAGNDYTDNVYEILKTTRLEWIKKANKKFGLNIQLVELDVNEDNEEEESEVKNDVKLRSREPDDHC